MQKAVVEQSGAKKEQTWQRCFATQQRQWQSHKDASEEAQAGCLRWQEDFPANSSPGCSANRSGAAWQDHQRGPLSRLWTYRDGNTEAL